MQRNLTCLHMYTHRKQIRCIKQGIESSIANHLEFLTSKWPKPGDISDYYRKLYQRETRVCKIWADANDSNNAYSEEIEDELSISSSTSVDIDEDQNSYASAELKTHQKRLARFTFNHNMYNTLTNTIIMKVFSHQLDADFQTSITGKTPKPNMFVVSGNQIADNTVEQARRIYTQSHQLEQDKLFYPPFSPKWTFSFQGGLTNKGATKVFQEQLDMELIYRHQCRLISKEFPFAYYPLLD